MSVLEESGARRSLRRAVRSGLGGSTHVTRLHAQCKAQPCARVRAARALAAQVADRLDDPSSELTGGDGPADSGDDEISDDPLLATYHLATLAPIGPADRFRLLACPGPAKRLDVLDEILDDVEAMLKFRLS